MLALLAHGLLKLIGSERDGTRTDRGVHLDLAIEVLKSLLTEDGRASLNGHLKRLC